ncbi:MAG: alkaline phosphatase [Kofleriaceae bacterium]|nr:MAG: alkaline phosphatase [Kofleriaceae bacterium]MBZ0238168.1 alkaline phosphatase D family protein [Kofleriaceae bacterium]
MKSKLSRRDVLRGAAALPVMTFLPALSGCDDGEEVHVIFVHGVASGDPTPEAVIIWTRVSTTTGPVEVQWEVSSDGFENIAASGMITTDGDRDWTVKIDVTGLSPATRYQYRFTALGETSRVGSARTAPAGPTERLRFAVASCASYPHGYYHLYRAIAEEELDAVLHLGDYIYEYGNGEYGDVRTVEPPTEIVTLADYRTRYAHYRLDPDLQAVHAAHAFITVWDDHELTDNAWSGGALNHQMELEGDFDARRVTAAQVYREWMPIRDSGIDGKIYRRLTYGGLVDLYMLDTRLFGRDQQYDEGGPPRDDAARQLLGAEQEAWLATELPASTATWKLVGQQVMMAQLPQFLNEDAWDGYPAARTRFFDLLEQHQVEDVVVLTGDIHSSWAWDLTRDPTDVNAYDPETGRGAIAVELVTPGITSPGLPESLADGALNLLAENRHLEFADVARRGFLLLDIDHECIEGAWHHMDEAQIISPEPQSPTVRVRVEIRKGTPKVARMP